MEFLKSGNYYKTTSIKRVEILHDDEGNNMHIPIETI